MAKVAGIQDSFNAGEFSPLMYGRVTFDKYKNALGLCENMIPVVQGPVIRRPGTMFVAETKDSSVTSRLLRFEFSVEQAYVLEFGNAYFRIYRNHGRNESGGGTPIEVATTYTTAELWSLHTAQSYDVMYVALADHAPRKVSRASDTSWSIDTLTFVDGPYFDANTTATAVQFGATTGSTTCTATAVTGINNDTGFQPTDVGRVIRAKTAGAAWGWATITAWTSTTAVTVSIDSGAPMGAALTDTTNWRMGLWSDTSGYPATVTFYQDRLGWAGASGSPTRVALSKTGNYLNHAPTAYDTSATVADDNGLAFAVASGEAQNVRWLIGDTNALLVGTISSVWAVAPSTLGEALTPTNINAVPASGYGVESVRPVDVGTTVLFLQRAARKVRELVYSVVDAKYKSPDMTVLAEHITRSGGVKEMAFSHNPWPILWAVTNDGTLIGMTYDREQSVIAWHRHELGGVGDSTGGPPVVESIAVIPAPEGTHDELWLIVRRYINGATVRYVEYMAAAWESDEAPEDAHYLDCALKYDGASATTITGLDHLEGEAVTVFADGAVRADATVASGAITIDPAASVVLVGYGYNSDGRLLRDNAGAANGTAQGKTQRTHRLGVRIKDGMGLSIGRDFTHLDTQVFRTLTDDLGEAVPLFTGDHTLLYDGEYSTENTPCWRWSGPWPGTILGFYPQEATQDR